MMTAIELIGGKLPVDKDTFANNAARYISDTTANPILAEMRDNPYGDLTPRLGIFSDKYGAENVNHLGFTLVRRGFSWIIDCAEHGTQRMQFDFTSNYLLGIKGLTVFQRMPRNAANEK